MQKGLLVETIWNLNARFRLTVWNMNVCFKWHHQKCTIYNLKEGSQYQPEQDHSISPLKWVTVKHVSMKLLN